MKALSGIANTAFLGFFSSHIVATIFIDAQAILPDAWIPQALQDFLDWYATTLKDPLMGNAKQLIWFQSLVCLEFLFQLPFFFWACSMLIRKTETYPEQFRYGCIAYGGHASTSMAPILASLVTNEQATITERITILSVYIPYLIFPLWILSIAMSDDSGQTRKKRA